eukprot:g970.t1
MAEKNEGNVPDTKLKSTEEGEGRTENRTTDGGGRNTNTDDKKGDAVTAAAINITTTTTTTISDKAVAAAARESAKAKRDHRYTGSSGMRVGETADDARGNGNVPLRRGGGGGSGLVVGNEGDVTTDSLSTSYTDDDEDLSDSSPGEPDYEQSYAQELIKANLLLRKTGVNSKPMSTVDELQKCASSMFVAVIESMLNRRLKSIVRVPKRRFDYVKNAQSVIDILNVVLRSNLQVSAQQISEGHLPSICNLVSVLLRMQELIASKRLKIPRSLLTASTTFLPDPSDYRPGVEGISGALKKRRNRHLRPATAPRNMSRNLGPEIVGGKKVYYHDDMNLGTNDLSESQTTSLPSAGYERALELLGGKNNAPIEDASRELSIQGENIWAANRERAAKLIRLQYKQEAAAHQRQQIQARKLFRLLERSQKHAQTVKRVKDEKFRSSILLQQVSHQVERQSREKTMWRNVKKKLLKMGRMELEDQRALQCEVLCEITKSNERQIDAENHVFYQKESMLQEQMKEEERVHDIRKRAQMDDFRETIRLQKLVQKRRLKFLREQIQTQHRRRMDELERNVESMLRMHSESRKTSYASTGGGDSVGRRTRRSHNRHVQLLRAYGRRA